MRTFSDIAADLEQKAKREKNEHRRADFKDEAHFYAALAEVIPAFPGGYTQYFDIAATQLDNRAEECRALAAAVADGNCRAKLLRLAETYQNVSDRIGAIGRPHLEPLGHV